MGGAARASQRGRAPGSTFAFTVAARRRRRRARRRRRRRSTCAGLHGRWSSTTPRPTAASCEAYLGVVGHARDGAAPTARRRWRRCTGPPSAASRSTSPSSTSTCRAWTASSWRGASPPRRRWADAAGHARRRRATGACGRRASAGVDRVPDQARASVAAARCDRVGAARTRRGRRRAGSAERPTRPPAPARPRRRRGAVILRRRGPRRQPASLMERLLRAARLHRRSSRRPAREARRRCARRGEFDAGLHGLPDARARRLRGDAPRSASARPTARPAPADHRHDRARDGRRPRALPGGGHGRLPRPSRCAPSELDAMLGALAAAARRPRRRGRTHADAAPRTADDVDRRAALRRPRSATSRPDIVREVVAVVPGLDAADRRALALAAAGRGPRRGRAARPIGSRAAAWPSARERSTTSPTSSSGSGATRPTQAAAAARGRRPLEATWAGDPQRALRARIDGVRGGLRRARSVQGASGRLFVQPCRVLRWESLHRQPCMPTLKDGFSSPLPPPSRSPRPASSTSASSAPGAACSASTPACPKALDAQLERRARAAADLLRGPDVPRRRRGREDADVRPRGVGASSAAAG